MVENYAKVFNVDVVELLELGHIKPAGDLLKEIHTMLKSATEEEIIVAHKILEGLLH